MMRILLALLLAALLVPGSTIARPAWSPVQAESLLQRVERAPDEGLALPPEIAPQLRRAIDAGERERLDPIADKAALTLMRAWRGRCCGQKRPSWWHIDGSTNDDQLRSGLLRALQNNQLDLYLRSIRPSHPYYARLVDALSEEKDADRRAIIVSNLARWRWLPARMGERYLLVNIAAQQLTLWEGGVVKGRWRVIVGKPVTRTPVFTSQVTGVVLNPWWEIPSSIAAEGIASFVRRSPSAARARGYIFQNGRYRQMPGDNNALGRMKLVMPNPYSVFLHDTSSRELFEKDRRFFSHGCIRVDRALSFAATLLRRDGWDLARIEEEVTGGKTQTVFLSEHIPLYVAYFTAEPSLSGGVRIWEDVYRRDPVTVTSHSDHELTDIYGSRLSSSSSNSGVVEGGQTCLN
ncbi:L,D-transpeptidase family protein [Erythrobacter ani]|uniref:L,D-transpeptidase family protein n=1 Tax=Erythrobacter ani TaxID=2827235 RepID=A0ABS6SKH1_9SPHN|nr:L,D-transpeptidase family protein [Erythrobacter ani]MBV7265486.1 L,D-transpeptidase family protein [Erythrobacter ani]